MRRGDARGACALYISNFREEIFMRFQRESVPTLCNFRGSSVHEFFLLEQYMLKELTVSLMQRNVLRLSIVRIENQKKLKYFCGVYFIIMGNYGKTS